jgi:hypothetical protein
VKQLLMHDCSYCEMVVPEVKETQRVEQNLCWATVIWLEAHLLWSAWKEAGMAMAWTGELPGTA